MTDCFLPLLWEISFSSFQRWSPILEEGDMGAEKAPLSPQNLEENRDLQMQVSLRHFVVYDA